MSDPQLLTTDLLPPLEIITTDRGWFTVRCGDRYQENLTADEALWVASSYLRGEIGGYLRTESEHAAFR